MPATSCSSSSPRRSRTPSREARGPDWLGLGVTAPYKRVVAELVDEVEADAATIGAVNNVVRTDDGRLIGINTDAPGFQAGVELAMGRPLAGAEVVVAGAGGAAHAVVFACLRAGARRVTVGNRTAAAAAALVERFAGVGAGARSAVALTDPAFETALRSADLAVNATTVGMLDPGVTIPVDVLPATATVFDLVYVPPETPLARGRPARAACGRRTAPRCSSRRPPSRSSAGPASAAWPTSCARPSRRSWPTRRRGPDRCASRRSSRTGGRGRGRARRAVPAVAAG